MIPRVMNNEWKVNAWKSNNNLMLNQKITELQYYLNIFGYSPIIFQTHFVLIFSFIAKLSSFMHHFSQDTGKHRYN